MSIRNTKGQTSSLNFVFQSITWSMNQNSISLRFFFAGAFVKTIIDTLCCASLVHLNIEIIEVRGDVARIREMQHLR